MGMVKLRKDSENGNTKNTYGIGPLGLSLSLGFASGAMLYVVFGEIIPQSVLMYRSKLPTFFVIVGILLGLLIIYY